MAVLPLTVGLIVLFLSDIKTSKICAWENKMHSSISVTIVIVIINNYGTSMEKV